MVYCLPAVGNDQDFGCGAPGSHGGTMPQAARAVLRLGSGSVGSFYELFLVSGRCDEESIWAFWSDV